MTRSEIRLYKAMNVSCLIFLAMGGNVDALREKQGVET
jgi:hypothetical protein